MLLLVNIYLLAALTVTSSLAIDTLAQPDLIMVSSLEPDSSTNPALLLTFSLKPSKSVNSDLIIPLSPMSRIFQYSPLHITFPVPYIYPFRVLYLHIIFTFRLFLSRDFFSPRQSISQSEYLSYPAYFLFFTVQSISTLRVVFFR